MLPTAPCPLRAYFVVVIFLGYIFTYFDHKLQLRKNFIESHMSLSLILAHRYPAVAAVVAVDAAADAAAAAASGVEALMLPPALAAPPAAAVYAAGAAAALLAARTKQASNHDPCPVLALTAHPPAQPVR